MRKRRERSERRPSGRGSLKKTKNMLGGRVVCKDRGGRVFGRDVLTT